MIGEVGRVKIILGPAFVNEKERDRRKREKIVCVCVCVCVMVGGKIRGGGGVGEKNGSDTREKGGKGEKERDANKSMYSLSPFLIFSLSHVPFPTVHYFLNNSRSMMKLNLCSTTFSSHASNPLHHCCIPLFLQPTALIVAVDVSELMFLTVSN